MAWISFIKINSLKNAMRDLFGLNQLNTVFGDILVSQRQDQVSAIFTNGLPSQTFQRIETWDVGAGTGTFTLGETIKGNTSGATGIIEVATTPIRIRTLTKEFTDGEIVVGIGITTTASGASRVISRGSYGYSSVSNGSLILSSGTTPNTTAIESAQLAPYHAGHELGALFTAAFITPSLGTKQYAGLFSRTGDNGIGVGYQGSTFGIIHKSAGSEVEWIPSTDFNFAPNLVRTSSSGLVFDPTKMCIYGIKVGYLGVAGFIVYGIDNYNRIWPIHQKGYSSQQVDTFIQDPHLTMRFEVTTTTATESVIKSGSWNVYVAGPAKDDHAPQRYNSYERSNVAVTSVAGETNLFSIRNNSTFNGATNRSSVKLLGFSIVGDGASGFCRLKIRKNSALTGSTFATAIDSLNSCCNVDTAASGGHTTGMIQVVHSEPNRSGEYVSVEDQNITIEPGETIQVNVEVSLNQNVWICVRLEDSI